MLKNIIFRKLTIEEAQSFWNLMEQLDSETDYMLYEPGERREKNPDCSALKSVIKDSVEGDNFLLAAEHNGNLVGYISAQKGKLNRIAHTAYIVIGILGNYRNMGIGSEFFNRLDLWAKEEKISKLELSVICENKAAKHLYEKNGFLIEGIKKKSICLNGTYLDEFYMGKILE